MYTYDKVQSLRQKRGLILLQCIDSYLVTRVVSHLQICTKMKYFMREMTGLVWIRNEQEESTSWGMITPTDSKQCLRQGCGSLRCKSCSKTLDSWGRTAQQWAACIAAHLILAFKRLDWELGKRAEQKKRKQSEIPTWKRNPAQDHTKACKQPTIHDFVSIDIWFFNHRTANCKSGVRQKQAR